MGATIASPAALSASSSLADDDSVALINRLKENLQRPRFSVDLSQLAAFSLALTSGIMDAYFANLFMRRLGAVVALAPSTITAIAHPTALLTGVTSFALGRASFLRAWMTLRNLTRYKKAGLYSNKILSLSAVFFLFSIVGATPVWQLARDTSADWPAGLATIFNMAQFTITVAINCRPLFEVAEPCFLATTERKLATAIRRRLMESLNVVLNEEAKISEAAMQCIVRRERTEAAQCTALRAVVKSTMLIFACLYAVSYYVASRKATTSWEIYFSLVIAVLAAALKAGFICRTGFNLIEKVVSSYTDTPILKLKNSSFLSPRAKLLFSMLSCFAGMVAATASAGNLLRYLIPQVMFLGSENSLDGVMAAITISLIANSFSKIFDIDIMLKNMGERILYCRAGEQQQLMQCHGQGSNQLALRLMRYYRDLSDSELLREFSDLTAEGRVINLECPRGIELTV